MSAEGRHVLTSHELVSKTQIFPQGSIWEDLNMATESATSTS